MPPGYGWRSSPSDRWVMNHMIHNLYPTPDRVYITYKIDFIPDSSPMAKKMKTVRTQWMDVEGLKAYPVFDVHKGERRKGKFTYPNDDPNAYRGDGAARNEWTVDRGLDAGRHRRAPAPGRPVRRPVDQARQPQGAAVPVAGEVLRAGGRRVVGRLDGGDARRTGG